MSLRDQILWGLQVMVVLAALATSGLAHGQPREVSDEELGELFGADAPKDPALPEEQQSFFDPAKIFGARSLQINGYVDATAFAALAPSRLGELGFAEAGVGLFVGAPIYEDKIYASIVLETGIHSGGSGSTLGIETAQLTWTPYSQLRMGAGIFLVPFGLEDEDHASPNNPLVTRPLSFAGALVYPGTFSDYGAWLSFGPKSVGSLKLFVISRNLVDQRQDIRDAQGFVNQSAALSPQSAALSPGALELRRQAHTFAGGLKSPEASKLRSYGAKLRLDGLISGFELGASAIYGQHGLESGAMGLDLYNFALGAHLDTDLGVLLAGLIGDLWPLPKLRAELVLTDEDRAIPSGPDLRDFEKGTRGRMGWYILAIQPLPLNLDLVMRYDEFDPDTDEGGDRGLDFSVGLRWRVVPNMTLKMEAQFTDEQGKQQIGGNSLSIQGAASF